MTIKPSLPLAPLVRIELFERCGQCRGGHSPFGFPGGGASNVGIMADRGLTAISRGNKPSP